MKRILMTLIFLFVGINLYSDGFTREDAKKKIRLRKPDIVDLVFVNYNNWSYVMRNTGSYMYDYPDTDGNGNNAGGEFPRGSGVTIVYAGGFYIGALKDGIPVVSETEFATEFQPGRIINSGVSFGQLKAEDPLLPSQKVYVIDRNNLSDWPEEALRDQFGNPALIADAQTWAVFNDLDTSLNQESIAESPDPGLGIQVTLESYAFVGPKIGDVVYLKFILENKTSTDYLQTHFGAWGDPDVGNPDDIVGVDTARGLGYVYNNVNESPNNMAAGFDILQGPVVTTNNVNFLLASKFASNTSVLVYDQARNMYTSSSLPSGKIWLGATSFEGESRNLDPSNDTERYHQLTGKERALGFPKNGCGRDDYYTFRGNPLTEQGTCDVAGSNNPRGGLFSSSGDMYFVLGVGPFDLKAGESQEIWVGVIGASGTDRLDAVANLWETDDFAQSFFDQDFPAPASPPIPKLSVSSLDGKTILTWQNNAEVSEDLSGEILGVSVANGYSTDYVKNDFQGYRVYRSLTGLDGSFTLLAQYDIVDTLGIITNRFLNTQNHLEIEDINLGTNTGLVYHFIDSNLTNGQNYFYSVTAYDAQPYIAGPDSMLFDGHYAPKPSGLPISLESSVLSNTVSAVPARPYSSLTYNASLDSSRAIHVQGPGDGYVTLEIVDASKVKTLDYTIEFFKIPSDSEGGTLVGSELLPSSLMAYKFVADDSVQLIDSRTDDLRTFYDKNSNGTYQTGTDIALDESVFATAQARFDDQGLPQSVVLNGIKATVHGLIPGMKNFLCIANGTGVLSSPDQAAFASISSGFPTRDGLPPDVELGNDVPQIPNLSAVATAASVANGAKWGFSVGGAGTNYHYNDGTTSSFWYRVFRGPGYSNLDRFVPYDFEMRFTAAGGQGNFAFSSGNQAAVPFEIWNVGIATPNDASDDYRMYPRVFDEGGAVDVWDWSDADHPISGGDNDPYTDWVYWMNPADMSPGQAGYNASVTASGGLLAAAPEVMARTILVAWNGGSVSDPTWPANALQQSPANGTVYRIVSTKPNQAGDVFTFSTTANSVLTSKKDLKRSLKDIKVVPNPFYKYSSYETQFDKLIKFTHLPEVCTIRIFTVAGDLVRTLNHNASSDNDRPNDRPYDETYEPEDYATSIEQWDLKTANGRYVASGMYIALIETSFGKRFVKFAIIQ